MSDIQDRWNCLKNLIRMMCIDGGISDKEKKFLFHAARELELPVENWGELVREVESDPSPIFPIHSEKRALAALKSMLVMAKMDRQITNEEKDCLRKFAKSVGVTSTQWEAIVRDTKINGLFEPFRQSLGKLLILREDFETLDPLLETARQSGIPADVTGYKEYLQSAGVTADAVCFHAASDRLVSVEKCRTLRQRAKQKTVAILTRYQGCQVRYLLEEGIGHCIIEPVYTRDLETIFSKR